MRSKLTTLCYVEKDGCYLMLHRVSKKEDINKDKCCLLYTSDAADD